MDALTVNPRVAAPAKPTHSAYDIADPLGILRAVRHFDVPGCERRRAVNLAARALGMSPKHARRELKRAEARLPYHIATQAAAAKAAETKEG